MASLQIELDEKFAWNLQKQDWAAESQEEKFARNLQELSFCFEFQSLLGASDERRLWSWPGGVPLWQLITTSSPPPVKTNLGKDKYNEMIKDVEFGTHSVAACVICQEEFKNKESLKITPCEHIFHPACISKWLEKECTRPTCPSCRHDCREEFKRGDDMALRGKEK